MSAKEQKKLADKGRKLLEKAHREKEAALRDDDNVFDVSYENQGDSTSDVVSATDIKASHSPLFPAWIFDHCNTLTAFPSPSITIAAHRRAHLSPLNEKPLFSR